MPDFGSLVTGVDFSTVVTGITAIAGVMVLPKAAKWGYRQVLSFLGR